MQKSIFLTNTLTHKKDQFIPLNPDHVGIYLCGPTVYDRPHIGNARSAVVFDILHRFFKYIFPKVTFVRNVTDVDDKINARAAELKCDIRSLTTTTLAQYHEDLDALYTLRPTIEPRATDHIPHMILMIEQLIKNNHAYVAQGHVLFDVISFRSYGSFSCKNQEDLIAGARVEVAPYKKYPADFVLWKPSEPGTPGWDSPFGFGRPGWHIECSAMSATYLGEIFDIHAGGVDLTFPHHENEIAQSRCAHGTDVMAKMWLHNGHLTVNGKKMSKSEGNFVTVHQLLECYDGELLRLALLSAHYHQPLDWNDGVMSTARNHLNRFYGALALMDDATYRDATFADIPSKVIAALSDDLNVPQVIAVFHELANYIFKNPVHSQEDAKGLYAAGRLIGIFNHTPDVWFKQTSRHVQKQDDLSDDELQSFIHERMEAKAAKDFKKADAIRDSLLEKGYTLLDTVQGTTWRRT